MVAVRYVIDGDTLNLQDGRNIRLIGIDTPEVGHHQRSAQPYADLARQQLVNSLPGDTRIGLIYDTESKDKYGRRLAHGFLPDGTNLQALQLSKGLATTLPIPPSLKFVNCYQQQQRLARQQQLGIWTLREYQALELDRTSKLPTGRARIRARVQRISDSKSAVWINLDGPLALRINKRDLKYFSRLDLYKLKGKMLEVQGWVYYRKGQARISLRHPVQLIIEPG